MAAQGWGGLDPRVRKLIIIGAIAEGALKLAVLVDLKRRPKDQIRGRKAAWASAMLINSAGVLPVSYFIWGRRRSGSSS